MIKAAIRLLCLICLTVSPALQAQTGTSTPASLAAQEAVKREANQVKLGTTLDAARNAQARNDLREAARLYQQCYDLAKLIGFESEPRTAEIVAGLTGALMQLAIQDQKDMNYPAADEKVARILIIDPQNQPALAFRAQNQVMRSAMAGRIPSQEERNKIPEFRTNEIKVATLVQDGRFLYENHRYDEAEAKLNLAISEDPENEAANHYLRMILEARNADALNKTELDSANALLQVEKAWAVEKRNQTSVARPNAFNRTNTIYTGKGRQKIMAKLDSIRIESIKYDNLAISEVLNDLTEIAQKRDPDNQGINFFINRHASVVPVPGAGALGGTAIDPATGLPLPAAGAASVDQVDVSGVTVKLQLKNVRLADVLEAIQLSAERPIKYSVLEYGIAFSLADEATPLEIRTFHVDPNTFQQGLQNLSGIPFGNITTTSGGGGGGGGVGGGGGGGFGGGGGGGFGGGGSGGLGGGGGSGGGATVVPQVSFVSATTGGGGGFGGGGGGGGIAGAGGGVAGGLGAGGGTAGTTGGVNFVTATPTSISVTAVRNFFGAVGVNLGTNTGKSVVWNDRKGTLLVRATAADLDLIEAAIETLNVSPPEVNIKVKFAEITQNDSRQLGFNWTLGNTLIGNSAALSGGTQPSFTGVATAANPAGTFPGGIIPANTVTGAAAIDTTTPIATTDGQVTGGLRNTLNAPTIFSFTSLSQPQLKLAIQALDQRDGVDVLTAPEVTTESGRQTQIQAVDIQTIVTANNATAAVGGGTAAAGGTTVASTAALAIQPTTQALPFGPALDVLPTVSADEYSVQMVIVPTVTEFLGYDNPQQFVVQAQVSGGTPLTAVLPLPHFRLREVITSVTVWDNQTLVMGGLMTDSVSKSKDSVPLLGDLPLVGRLFQSESTQKTKKNLLIFVTPTIVNPDGTRYHDDSEMPFLQNVLAPKAVTQKPGSP